MISEELFSLLQPSHNAIRVPLTGRPSNSQKLKTVVTVKRQRSCGGLYGSMIRCSLWDDQFLCDSLIHLDSKLALTFFLDKRKSWISLIRCSDVRKSSLLDIWISCAVKSGDDNSSCRTNFLQWTSTNIAETIGNQQPTANDENDEFHCNLPLNQIWFLEPQWVFGPLYTPQSGPRMTSPSYLCIIMHT